MALFERVGTGIKRSTDYFRGVWSELKKVRWPNRKELISYTIVVFVTVAFISVFFAVLDMGLSQLVGFILPG